MPMRLPSAALLLALLLPGAAGAEVKLATPDALVIEHRFAIAATPMAAWNALVHPERFWPNAHTWSGEAANMSLTADAGGCFCERWSGGSAEHGRVLMAIPGKVLRIRGSLGPFQDMGVTGVLTVTLAATATGTDATVTYRLFGNASHRLGDMASGVDPVIRQQFEGFAAQSAPAR
ncbi:MAG: SRPBCC domain-containing protein [Steroidobacteraceae bacterium]|nr:SRPBCC domain-containing protein [Steroidobacteraceae bacterium]